jgi:WD40 repeat protein
MRFKTTVVGTPLAGVCMLLAGLWAAPARAGHPRPRALEGYDDWILVMSVSDDGRLIVTGPGGDSTVIKFDVTTGRRLGEIHPSRVRRSSATSCWFSRESRAFSCTR